MFFEIPYQKLVEVKVIVGVPREIKENEYRIGMVPVGVEELRKRHHRVLVQKGAGIGSNIPDKAYKKAGARIVNTPEELYSKSKLIVKVKEPLPREYKFLKESQAIFTFFHFAADKKLTMQMVKSKVICVAYETVEDQQGALPLLIPMSEVAGRMSVQEGAKYLEKPMLGRGILLSGVPGVKPANIVIIGGGVVGANAAKVARGLGASVTILDIDLERLRYLDDIMQDGVTTLMSNTHNIKDKLLEADLLITAALVRGARAPILVTRQMLKLMKPGAVIVDVAIDQGGCCETSRPTTHSDPTYVVDGIVHYCVTNIPGAVAGTATYALTNATLSYCLELADKGPLKAMKENPHLAKGLNIIDGKVTYKAVADQFSLEYYPVEDILDQIV